MSRNGAIGFVIFGVIALVGCEDKAKPSYAKCVTADSQGNFQHAWDACNEAIAADPTSTSGKAAAAKLAESKYVAWKKSEDDRSTAASAAKAQSDAVVAQAALERLKAKATFTENGEDDKCVSKGMPPHAFKITGGTYDENYAVAQSKGCVREYAQYGSAMSNYYCCP